MFGMTQDEGALMAGSLLKNKSTGLKQLTADFRHLLPDLLEFHATAVDPIAMADAIWDEYIAGRTGKDLYRSLSNMLSDRMYYHGIFRAVRLLQEDKIHGPFLFYLSRKPFNNSIRLAYGDKDEGLDELGVSHTDDLFYLFPDRRLEGYFAKDSEDGAMTRWMVRLFTSFARGDVSRFHPSGYLELKSPIPEFRAGPLPFEKRMRFWDRLLDHEIQPVH